MTTNIGVTKKEVSIAYLDDDHEAIDNFETKVSQYNISEQSYDDGLNIKLVTFLDFLEATEYFGEKRKVDVFVCDHNMPSQKGLDFILKYLKPEFPKLVYVLYTGAGNLNDNVKVLCEKNDILFANKSEDFSTLIERISSKMLLKYNPMDAVFKHLTKEIIEDIRLVENDDPSFLIYIGDRPYKPGQLLSEINNRTTIGAEYLIQYIEGLKFFNH